MKIVLVDETKSRNTQKGTEVMHFKAQIVVLLLAIFALLPTTGSAQFWYSSDGPSPLTIDSSRLVISFTDDPADTAQALLDIPQIEQILNVPYAPQRFAVCSLSAVTGHAHCSYDLTELSQVNIVVTSPTACERRLG